MILPSRPAFCPTAWRDSPESKQAAAHISANFLHADVRGMSDCLIVQPIHPWGIERLKAAGITPLMADRADMETVGRMIGTAVAVITRSAGLSAAAMNRATRLKVVASHGIGADTIAIDHATALGILVINTPDANRASVAEQTMALILALAKRIIPADAATRAGNFDFKYTTPLTEIAGTVLGLVGFGGIGARVAAMAKTGFGMDMLVHSASVDNARLHALGYRTAPSLEALLREADVVSLHRILTDGSRKMIGPRELAAMKPGAILINTARGGLVDEDALAAALAGGRLAGAGLDVFSREPLACDHPLLRLPNVVLSPHVSGSTEAALRRTAIEAAEGVIAALAGTRPRHFVNPAVWPNWRGHRCDSLARAEGVMQ